MSAAAKNPAIAQSITFWKKVACTRFIRASRVPVLHQNPHCWVFIIQSPRSKFVIACVKMHDDRLFVR